MTKLLYEYFAYTGNRKKYKDLIAEGLLHNGCVLCKLPAIKTFTYWRVVPNDFPYDRVADVHHMIIHIRHTIESNFTED